ncbi:unnamed protein product [Hyaloperonospora brassicae]|uniref:Uncharacterized protein n=1 Tax=Hyaloperonospora brassicae TaxID=162125 RepID=A0AAV0TZE5_HYABA|nr:unnamed protein product [Hyaloperonospora brassicae]
MLAVSTPSIDSNQRRHRGVPFASHRPTSCSRRAVATTAAASSANDRKHRTHYDDHQVESDVTVENRMSHKVPRRALISWRDVLVFRLVTSRSLDDDLESDDDSWDESEDERLNEDEEDCSEAGNCLWNKRREEDNENDEEEEEVEREPDDDLRWWKSSEDKRTWERHYWQADAAFRRRFGCAIDTLTHPEIQNSAGRGEAWWRTAKFVLASLVLVCVLVQVALVVSASSSMLSMTTGRELAVENDAALGDACSGSSEGKGGGSTSTKSDGQSGADLWPSDPFLVPEYVHTGLRLCAKLSRRVVESEHDTVATQHALRACNIAANFAPESSRESIEAHVLRGDLHSLLLRYDRAEEDYKSAATAVRSIARGTTNTLPLMEDLDIKILANRWTQLFVTKRYEELRREAKARVTRNSFVSAASNLEHAASELAVDWLRAFRQEKPILEVLTLQRGWTLRGLEYEAFDGALTSV